MTLLWITVILFRLCMICESGPSPPKYGDSYEVSAVIFLPYAEISEPVHVRYEGPKNRSRVDYYGGTMTEMDKTFAPGLPNGVHYVFAYVTNQTVYNQYSCFQLNATWPGQVKLINVLPNLQDFKFKGSTKYKEKTVNIFQKVDVEGKKVSTYTFMVDAKQGAPVFYEMMGYNTLMGSHFDKYYIEYLNFSAVRTFEDMYFQPPMGISCRGFPGPAVSLDHTSHSPIREFVQHETHHVDDAFENFKKTHGKNYTGSHHESRKAVFRQNFRYINSKNRAGLPYKLKVNHLADRTDKEMGFMRGYRYSKGDHGGQTFDSKHVKTDALPDQWDWRLMGAVTPVKDQAMCGSCWSFATTGTIEGAYFLKTGYQIRLSQQELMDCSWGFGNYGCNGGEEFRAYQWVIRTGGIANEDEYGPYKAIDGKCHMRVVSPVVQLKNFTFLPPGDVQALKAAIYSKGPVSVGMDAAHRSLVFYSSGIYYEPRCKNASDALDHSVLAVGYGTLGGQDYWLIKNSWSTYWGNDGYLMISQKDNNCGVSTTASYAEIA